MAEPQAYLFWDNSNIFISAQQVVPYKDPGAVEKALRVHFLNLYKLAVAGRSYGGGVAVGSVPPEQRGPWRKMKEDTGIDLVLLERGQISGTEQGVDQMLQTRMLRTALDNQDNPQVAVLLTGDGAGFSDGIGFHADMERLYKNGWGVEVLAWDASCKRELREWAEEVGVYVKLEDYYDSVTYIEGGRPAKNLSLTRRHKAANRKSPSAIQLDEVVRENEMLKQRLDSREKYNEKQKKRDKLHQHKRRRRRHR